MPRFVHRTLLRLGQILSLAALLATCGGHWVVIQSFAWARMIVENAESSQFSVAVQKTFDGKHPCEICKSIASAKGKESKQQRTVVASKLTLFCEEGRAQVWNLSERGLLEYPADELTVRHTAPAVPPPRSEAV